MKKYHRLEVLWRATRQRKLIGLVSTSFKMIRARFFSRRQLYFALASSQLDSLPIIEIDGYELKQFRYWNEVDGALREELIPNIRFIGPPQQLLEKGACLWVGYIHGEAACFLWSQTGDQVHHHFFPLLSDDVLFTRGATVPAHRGLGLLPATLVHIVRVLSAQGIKCFYAGCLDWNLSSRRSIERAEFKFIGYATGTRLGRFSWHQLSRPDFTCTNYDIGF